MAVVHDPQELFDRNRRRLFRDRAWSRVAGNGYFAQIMADELIHRLDLVNRSFEKCLLIGQAPESLVQFLAKHDIKTVHAETSIGGAAGSSGVQCDEDRLPFRDHSFDLILTLGTLDSVNDLPGALTLMRRILEPDGLMLGALVGAESLVMLKAALMAAEGDRVQPHVHPQIDIRTMGDLMTRAGFALPVVDGDTLDLSYGHIDRLIGDIRDMGGGNALNGARGRLSRSTLADMVKQLTHRSDNDGKIAEQVTLIYLCGWAPHPDQPQPARRGSGSISLKTALQKDRGETEG